MGFWRTRSGAERESLLDRDAMRADEDISRLDTDDPDEADWAGLSHPDPEREAELAERLRARAARLDARRDLERLRTRHWSGERILEEGRARIEWWEHPEADPFAVLGLLPGASLSEASAARRRIAQAYHPDRVGPDDDDVEHEAQRRMVAANAAYDRLRRALHRSA